MAAYATYQRELLTSVSSPKSTVLHLATARNGSPEPSADLLPEAANLGAGFVAQLVDQLADRVAAAVVDRIADGVSGGEEWYDSRHAAEYLGLHRDTLRKLAAERTIPAEQDGPGCKLFFRRSDLDAWRRSGGRLRRLASVA
jgi:excisionase family DNA binding protein